MTSYSKDSRHVQRTMEKSLSQKLHAKTRAKQRLGLNLTPEVYEQLLDAIQKCRQHRKGTQHLTGMKLTYKEMQTARVDILTLDYRNSLYDVVFDNERNTIVSFVPHRDADTVYRFKDIFKDTINFKDRYGITVKIIEGKLSSPSVDIVEVEPNLYHFIDLGKYLKFESGQLYEVMY